MTDRRRDGRAPLWVYVRRGPSCTVARPSERGSGTASASGSDADARVREYWNWIAAALFLFTAVDVLTTVFAAHVVGAGAEANPLIAWTLTHGPAALAGVNLLAALLVVGLFRGVLATLERTPPPYDRYYAIGIEAWLGVLLAAGLGVFANNLAVIVLGRSLLG